MVERTGGCLCGSVRYRVTGDPLAARVCWCRDCQRIAGNGTVNALFPSGSVETTGPVREHVRTGGSGAPVRRLFCPDCGCHVFADAPAYGGVVVVRVGTLDDPSSIAPSANIWSSRAPGWACLDAGLRRIERQPAPAAASSGDAP